MFPESARNETRMLWIDHLKIEKDGRLVNRAPAPQLPARITNNNNNITTAAPVTTTAPSTEPPTREQLDSIRKYQVSLYRPSPVKAELPHSGVRRRRLLLAR